MDYNHNNTKQHSVRMTDRLWKAYRRHRNSLGSNASEGVRDHVIDELTRAGLMTEEMLLPDPPRGW